MKHFASSYVIFASTSVYHDRRAAFTLSLSAGLCKEIYDGFFRRGFSYRDLVWDIAGVMVGYLLIR